MNEAETILLVDDSENDLLLVRRAFKRVEFSNPLQEAHNGEEAIAYLRGDGAYADRKKFALPALMLLDLNMPMKGGFEVLNWVRTQERIKRLSVIVLTASMRAADVDRAFDLGANAFLVKPSSLEALAAMAGCLRSWIRINQFSQLNDAASRR